MSMRFVLPVLVAAMGFAACSGKKSEPAPAPAATPRAEPDPLGRWTIVAHRIPGVSAMSDDEAATWHGRVFDLTANLAVFGGDTCEAPSYGYGTKSAARFLGEDYHVAPFTLDIADSTIGITWVSCNDEFRRDPGGVLIWAGPNRLFTPWDGVFFELTRDSTQTHAR
ncbi:MAG TPA: hypothetical protein VFX92_13065 [Candidatus Krumholzibacteria bacterium]|nr:hypothetical protein [Candidatus Krumholzibacteria bacterium]